MQSCALQSWGPGIFQNSDVFRLSEKKYAVYVSCISEYHEPAAHHSHISLPSETAGQESTSHHFSQDLLANESAANLALGNLIFTAFLGLRIGGLWACNLVLANWVEVNGQFEEAYKNWDGRMSRAGWMRQIIGLDCQHLCAWPVREVPHLHHLLADIHMHL